MFRFACSVVLRGGRGTADKRHWPVWGALAVFWPHWICPCSRVCALPSTLLRLLAALQGAGPALRAPPRPKPLRSGSQVLHKDADSVGPAFYAFPGQSGSGNRELEERTLPGAVRLLPSTVPASVSGHALSGASCVSSWELISGCDPPGRCQPSRISGSLVRNWKPVCSLVEMPSLGPSLPLSSSGWRPPPTCLLPPTGDGLVRSQLALLWCSLSPLFCEQAGSALG